MALEKDLSSLDGEFTHLSTIFKQVQQEEDRKALLLEKSRKLLVPDAGAPNTAAALDKASPSE